jgi:hypothetical protein
MRAALILLGLAGGFVVAPSPASEKKEPSAAARQTANLLKADLAKCSLRIYGWCVKPERPAVRVVANKDLLKPGEENAFVVPEAQMRDVIDALLAAGQFDKPQYVPPPGPPGPGWYLYVSVEDTTRPRAFQWVLGGPEYDLSKDPTVGQLLTALKGDAKKALEQQVDPTGSSSRPKKKKGSG